MNFIRETLLGLGIESITDTSMEDLRKAVVAEHVSVRVDDAAVEVTFDFLCPNCGKRHWARELDISSDLFSTVGWTLNCGQVTVRMPWAQTPERDSKSIYGQTKCEREEAA